MSVGRIPKLLQTAIGGAAHLTHHLSGGNPPVVQHNSRGFVHQTIVQTLDRRGLNNFPNRMFQLQKPAECVARAQEMHRDLIDACGGSTMVAKINNPNARDIARYTRHGPVMWLGYGAVPSDQGGHATGYPFHHAFVVMGVIGLSGDKGRVALVMEPNDLQQNVVMDALHAVVGKDELERRVGAADESNNLWSLLTPQEAARVDAQLTGRGGPPVDRRQVMYRLINLDRLVDVSEKLHASFKLMDRQHPLAVTVAQPCIRICLEPCDKNLLPDEAERELADLLEKNPQWIEQPEIRPDTQLPLHDGGRVTVESATSLLQRHEKIEEILSGNPPCGHFD